MTGRLVRLIWRLYPRRWRERFGTEAEADLVRMGPAGTRGWRLVVDALATLVRAWAHELRSRRPRWEEVGRDARLALRSMGRSPLAAGVVVLTLALAVGANGAVFSVTRAVLLGTLPYDSPDRIVHVRPGPVSMVAMGDWVVDEEFLELPGVEAAALYIPHGGANLVADAEAARVGVTFVGPDFFRVLGVEPLLGPGLAAAASGGETRLAALSHALWVRAFGADPGVVGRTVRLSGHTFQVVGIVPADVDFPSGTDVWAPMPAIPEFFGGALGPSAVARLTPDASRATLLAAHRARVEVDWADAPAHISRPEVSLPSLRDTLVGPVRVPLLVLVGAAAAVLLLGCMNLAGIHLSRLAHRMGEVRVRQALGAGRPRIVRQLVVETLVLATAGGAAALAVAALATSTLTRWLPPGVPGLDTAGLSPAVAAFIAMTSVLAGLAIGVPAALRASRAGPVHGSARRTVSDRHPVRLQSALLVAQVAVAAVLTLGAALLGRGLAELREVPLGYDTEQVLTFEVQLPASTYPDAEARRSYARRMEDRLGALPGIVATGTTNRLPLSGAMGVGMSVLLPGETEDTRRSTSWVLATEGYFRAMGIRLLAGRPPTEGPAGATGTGDVEGGAGPTEARGAGGGAGPEGAGDAGGGPQRPVRGTGVEVVIDRTLAATLFGDGPAVGRRILLAGFQGNEEATVSGVAEPVRLRGRDAEAHPVVWTPLRDDLWQRLGFAVRASGDPAAWAGAVRTAVAEIDPAVPPHALRTTGAAASEELAARRAVATVSGLFGVAALLLVALGLYGLVAQGVAARRRELGIRLALGAAAGRLVGSTVGRALRLVALGLAVGVPAAVAAGHLLESLLQEVPPGDPLVLSGVTGVILAVGLAAAWIPAARAGRVDPAESLREE